MLVAQPIAFEKTVANHPQNAAGMLSIDAVIIDNSLDVLDTRHRTAEYGVLSPKIFADLEAHRCTPLNRGRILNAAAKFGH